MNFKEFVLGFFLWLTVALLVAGLRWSRLYNSPALSSEGVTHLYLSEDMGPDELTRTLEDEELLRSNEEFNWAVNTLHWKSFKRGHYKLDRDISYERLFSKLARGLQDPINLTILPGYSESQIVERIADSFSFDSTALKTTLSDSAFLAEQGIDTSAVIGRLFPNTYSFYWTTSPERVMKRVFDTFQQDVVAKYDDRFKELEMSPDEITTLASIIEWEAGADSEKDTISGLYWNRLERGMRLQADPTVNFAVGQRRRLTFKDYEVEHPYNTYLYSGLPPGPVTNPSASSIEAALYPAEHDYLYMVASPKGVHNFSKTYREHQRKSAEWRQWIQEQYRIKRQQERENENK